MTPEEWAERYLTARREGSKTEATDIYYDAIMDLSYYDAGLFADLVWGVE